MKKRKLKIKTIGFVLLFLLSWIVLWKVSDVHIKLKHQKVFTKALCCMNKGSEFYDQGKYGLAIKEFKKALELCPSLDSARENLNLALQRADPEYWVDKHPHDENARKDLFIKCLENGDFDKARAYEAMFSDPDERDRCIKAVDDLEKHKSFHGSALLGDPVCPR